MARLPDVTALGARPVPQPRVGMASQNTEVAGNAMAGFGEQIGRVGGKIIDDIQRERDVQDVFAARRQLDDWERDARAQAKSKKEKDAEGIEQTIAAGFDEQAAKLAGTFKTKRAQQSFSEMAIARRESLLNWASHYVETEREAAATSSFNADVKTLIANASESPDRAPIELGLGKDRIRAFMKLRGKSQNDIDLAVGEFADAVHIGVVKGMLANKNTVGAKSYFDSVKETMGVKARGALNEEVRKTSDAIEAIKFVDDLWVAKGPRLPNDPVMVSEMSDAARSKYANDPDMLKVVIAGIDRKAAEFNAQQKELNTANTNAVMGAYMNDGKRKLTVAEVMALPQFKAMSETARNTFIRHMEDDVYRDQVRATASMARQEQLLRLADATRDRNTAASYFAVSDPRVLSKMSIEDVKALLPVYGERRTAALMDDWAKLQHKEALLRASVDRDMFNRLAKEAGFDAYDTKKSEKDRLELGMLYDSVKQAVTAFQIRKGDKATEQEVRAEMQRVIDDKVMVDRGMLRPDWSRPASMLTVEEQKNAYVPVELNIGGKVKTYEVRLSEISAEDEVAIRESLAKRGREATWDNIARLWATKRYGAGK